jgi:hypothetical protein
MSKKTNTVTVPEGYERIFQKIADIVAQQIEEKGNDFQAEDETPTPNDVIARIQEEHDRYCKEAASCVRMIWRYYEHRIKY